MKVCLIPNASQTSKDNGIGRVVHAQYQYLPALGVEMVDDPQEADVIAAHGPVDEHRLDVLHCHGLYFTDVPHAEYSSWHYKANQRVIDMARKAKIITVPSNWVAKPFRRDMRVSPVVIGHGIEVNEWSAGENFGYVLWNKNRQNDVCDPAPAWLIAEAGNDVVSTFAPDGKASLPHLRVIGTLPHKTMKEIIQAADVYLATTLETFGIGTLEAMASGVPVLGYRWGGTAELVTHGVNGYLVEPGDINGLLEGLAWIKKYRKELSFNAREAASAYAWEEVMGAYFDVYREASKPRQSGVAVVIPCYNYAEYVGEAIQSVFDQSEPPAEIIVVDDGSTDSSRDVIGRFFSTEKTRFKTIFQENSGVAAARNNGIAATEQPLIVCLDADDRLDTHYIQACRPVILADWGIGVAYTGLKLVNGDGTAERATEWPPDFDWNIMTKVENPPSNCIPSGAMFQRRMWERAGGYRQEYAPGEDTEFWVRGLATGFQAKKVTGEPLFHYRTHPNSASLRLAYKPINDTKPWMIDKGFPMAAPSASPVPVRSYLNAHISVIIPVGNGHERTLRRAIESIVAQTFRDWELIIVDDTSAGMIDLPIFARVIRTKGGVGAGAARNAGIDATVTPTLLFLDADDYLAPEALEEMLTEYVKQKSCRYVYSDWFGVNEKGVVKQTTTEYNQREWRMQHAVTVLMSTSAAKELRFDENLASWEDWDFFIKAAIQGICGVRIAKHLLYYNTRSGGRRSLVVEGNGQTPLGDNILNILANRYEAYYSIGGDMGSCCGGSNTADSIIALKTGKSPVRSDDGSGEKVRLVYIGSNQGAISFTINKRTYRGAMNAIHRYVDVPPQDVEQLVATGQWAVVAREEKPVESAPHAMAMVQSIRSTPPPPPPQSVTRELRPTTLPLVAAPVPESASEDAPVVIPDLTEAEIAEMSKPIVKPARKRKVAIGDAV